MDNIDLQLKFYDRISDEDIEKYKHLLPKVNINDINECNTNKNKKWEVGDIIFIFYKYMVIVD